MVIQAFAFYLFAGILIVSALMVITARNPVHSVLFLVLAFFNAAGIFILLGAEFIAMILVIVYVGAVAVLFLFVVMMLEINFSDLRKGGMQYIPLGIVIGGILLFELITVYTYWQFAPEVLQNTKLPVAEFGDAQNAEALGLVLYTEYIFPFQMAGLILFVAMIGSIVLTLRTRPGIRKQKVSDQHARKASDVLEVKKIASRTGA
ncbi:MAG: NADH:ubiquinone oxidoreductase subunit J [Zetaproteobacteria bacterium]|nr:MAG: NADH:ubiquinone oxidoreductase subunit J [Zetaproteobacteria bacterium]